MSTDMNISRPTSRVSTAPGGASSMSELLTHTCTPVHKHLVKTPAKEDHMFGIFQNTVDKNMEAGSEPILPLPVAPVTDNNLSYVDGETEAKHQQTTTFTAHDDIVPNKFDHSKKTAVAGVDLTTVAGESSTAEHVHSDHVADVKHMHLVDGANADHLNSKTKVTINAPTQLSTGDHMHEVKGANQDHWEKGQVNKQGDEIVASAITGHHVHSVKDANPDHLDAKTKMDSEAFVPTIKTHGDHMHVVKGTNEDHWTTGTVAPEDTHGHMHMVQGANADHFESGQAPPKQQHNAIVPGANPDHWTTGQIDKQGLEEAKTSITGTHLQKVKGSNDRGQMKDHIFPGTAIPDKKPHHLDNWDCGPVKPRVKHMHLVDGANMDHIIKGGGNDGHNEITGHHVHGVKGANSDHWESGQAPAATSITGHHVHHVEKSNPDHFQKGNEGGDAKLHFGPSSHSKHAFHKHLVKGESGVDDMGSVLIQPVAFAKPPQVGRNPLQPKKQEITGALPSAGKLSGIGTDSAPTVFKPTKRRIAPKDTFSF